MHIKLRLTILALLLPLPAVGQAPLSLSDAVRIALDRRPELKAADARVTAAQGMRKQAGLFPNPRFIFQAENHSRIRFSDYGNDADSFAYFSQVIETSGRRGNRIAVGEANLGRSQLEDGTTATGNWISRTRGLLDGLGCPVRSGPLRAK